MKIRAVVLPLLLAGCASTTAVPTGAPTTRTTQVTAADARYQVDQSAAGADFVSVPAAPDAVWDALAPAYEALGMQGRVLDAERRIFGQPETTVRRQLGGTQLSRFLDCGNRVGVVNANSYSVTLTVTSYVRPGPAGGAQLRTQVDAMARAPGSSEAPVRCGTTNELERRIESIVRERTAGR